MRQRNEQAIPMTPRHALALPIFFGYVFFVVYGSLVPLEFVSLPLDQAWAIFQGMPMYEIGEQGRADWIANGVLFVPVGFLSAHLLMQKFARARPAALFFIALLFSVAFAVSVEFTQIFFPQRTVSLNDIIAECTGSLIGVVLAARYSDWFKLLLNAIIGNPRRLALRLLESYLLAYLAFSLFPYDILVSGIELEQKIRSHDWGWLLAGETNEPFLVALKSFSEIILTLPFGLFLGYRSGRRSATYAQAIFIGLLLGALIEVAQFFTSTGVAQGLSAITRSAGVCCGLALWNRRGNWSAEKLARLIERHALPLGVTYLLILLDVNGFFSHRWNDAGFTATRIGGLHFLPFYYHYYTTEARALVSLAVVCLSYLPIGLLTWSHRGTAAQAFYSALFAAGLVETGKLFLPGMRPDPTNILLGALVAWAVVRLARVLSDESPQPSRAETQALQIKPAVHPDTLKPRPGKPAIRWTAGAVVLPSLAFAAYQAASFPTSPVALSVFLAACAAIIWHRPERLLLIILAALPVLDLAPLSGRFFLDEFDLLVLTSLAIAHYRTPSRPNERRLNDPHFSLIGGLLALSFGIAAVRGLLPWQPPDANAFTNYYSPFNSLRIAKGALWAWLSYRLLRRMVAAGWDVLTPLAWGLASGLSLTLLVVLWERLAFSGPFNFASDYRITGPFSSMHTGGAYIECFLAIAAPFLTLLVLQSRNQLGKLLGVLLLLATTYALMVTFSRNGYAAFAAAMVTILFFATFKSGRWQRIFALALSVATLAVALPVFTGQFAQSRMSTVEKDYEVRKKHWQEALNMRTPDWLTELFGMGLGRYPQSHYLLSDKEGHSGTYQLKKEDGNSYLRLASGSSIYVEQLVQVKPRQIYFLKLDVRADKPMVDFTIPICEKWLLTSYNCIWNSLNVGQEAGVWHHFELRLNSNPLIISPWYARRPIKLALYNGEASAVIDVDNVRLETIDGENLVSNGGFSEDLDHWFFSSDNHLQWHAKSLPIAVLFDQGWLGLIALGLFLALALKRAAARAWRGDRHAAAALSSLTGFLVVGLFDTLIDAPRFLFLLLLLCWYCASGNIGKANAHESG
jgi:VanZ family protein